MSLRYDISSQQELQAALLRVIAAMRPEGALGEAVRYATVATHRYAVSITPVDTGSQRAALTPEVDLRNLRGTLFYDPNAVNPRSTARPSRYGPENEQVRGGRYAVFQNTFEETQREIASEVARIIVRALP